MKSIVEVCRDVVREREGAFLTVMLGNASLYVLPDSVTASVMVDAYAAHQPQAFVEAVGLFLQEHVEVA